MHVHKQSTSNHSLGVTSNHAALRRAALLPCAALPCCPAPRCAALLQAGGKVLDVPAVEITYGLERILMSLQGVKHFKDIR